MLKTISATKARINFGDVMKQAKIAPVIVERGGKAEVVVLSKKAYDQLVAAKSQTDWRRLLEESRKTVRAALKDHVLPNPAEMIRLGREERDEQLLSALH